MGNRGGEIGGFDSTHPESSTIVYGCMPLGIIKTTEILIQELPARSNRHYSTGRTLTTGH